MIPFATRITGGQRVPLPQNPVVALRLFLLPTLAFTVIFAHSADTPYESQIRPLLSKYCINCHGSVRPKAGLNLDSFKDIAAVRRDPKTWENVAKQVRQMEMPPEGKPQPPMAERQAIVAWADKTLQSMDSIKDPGRVLIHRLSRTEYNNTIRDLLGLDSKPADKFPADGAGGEGFDNTADTLFIPPILMEKYLAAADSILDEAPQDRVITLRPGQTQLDRGAAKKILEQFVPRAFRRPAEKEEIERLVSVYEGAQKRGDSFEDSVKLALKAVLVSPHFLFRIETDQATPGPYQINDYELASRLSYFIWSSMPDSELFELAKKKKLHEPQVLEAQVKRMIADPKSRALADNFAGQWLGVKNLKTTVQPDRNKFKAYTPELRDALYEEPITFFHHLLREDASLLEMLNCNYTYLNEDLAKHYGIPDVKGPEFRRVTLNDPNRGGVLGMGAVLTLTSYPQRTSPVLRGKWVLEELLGTPSPPPPANVGLLPPDDSSKDGKTFRQRLEIHRQKAECAACHKRMDPLGFGLENFDAIGRWRTEVSGQKVDASGELVSGEKFNGAAELKKLLMKQKDDFLRNASEKMLSYALGRGLEFYDRPAVKKIIAALNENGCRSSVLINEVVKSFPFQYRRNAPIEASNP